MTSSSLLSTTSENAPWVQNTLELFTPISTPPQLKPYLFQSPSSFGEIFERDDQPQPTPSSELPALGRWVPALASSILEIWAGMRQPGQIADRCHRVIYSEILKRVGCIKEIGKIKSLHICQPLDGICEAHVLVRFNNRYRSLVLRAEGIDGRWLCTEVDLL